MRIHIYIEKENLKDLNEALALRNFNLIPKYFRRIEFSLKNELEVSITTNEYLWLEDNK